MMQEEANRQEAERQEQIRRDLQAKREKEAQAAKLCDQLAGNPNDPRRAGEGVPFETVVGHADEAIRACERAIAQYPSEPRFQYQLARALAVNERNRKQAVPILQKLVASRYPRHTTISDGL
jgi:cytochrome c-type biogenesis protein CcmH/NrfG